MARSKGGPSHSAFSHFRCESGYIVDINRKTWECKVVTKYTSKDVPNVQIMSPYHHYIGGEGFHYMPEVGATCLIAFPSDNSYPFILGYLGTAALTSPNAGEDTDNAEEFGRRSRRPQMNPGDMAITGRDGNFLFLRRGGVVQIGATALAQTVYLPIGNYIKQFCENFELATLGGDLSWTVEPNENDPSGNAPSTFVFHLHEFAQDAKASIRARMFPIGGAEDPKVVWDFAVAPQGINKEDGSIVGQVYTLAVALDGTRTEFLGANRSTTITGNDTLDVSGNSTTTVGGNYAVTASGSAKLKASGAASLEGSTVSLGTGSAQHGVPLGDKFVQALAGSQWIDSAGAPVTLSPASIPALMQALSTRVFTD